MELMCLGEGVFDLISVTKFLEFVLGIDSGGNLVVMDGLFL